MGKASDARRAREASARRVAKRLGTSQAGSAKARTATIKKVTRSGGGGGGGSSKTVTVVSAPTAPETVGQQTVTRDGTTLTFAAGTTQAQIDAAFASSAAYQRDVQALTEGGTRSLTAQDVERLATKYNLSTEQKRELAVAGSKTSADFIQDLEQLVANRTVSEIPAAERSRFESKYGLSSQESADLFGEIEQEQRRGMTFQGPAGMTPFPMSFATQRDYEVARQATRPKTVGEVARERAGKFTRRIAEKVGRTAEKPLRTLSQKEFSKRAAQSYKQLQQTAKASYAKAKELYGKAEFKTATTPLIFGAKGAFVQQAIGKEVSLRQVARVTQPAVQKVVEAGTFTGDKAYAVRREALEREEARRLQTLTIQRETLEAARARPEAYGEFVYRQIADRPLRTGAFFAGEAALFKVGAAAVGAVSVPKLATVGKATRGLVLGAEVAGLGLTALEQRRIIRDPTLTAEQKGQQLARLEVTTAATLGFAPFVSKGLTRATRRGQIISETKMTAGEEKLLLGEFQDVIKTAKRISPEADRPTVSFRKYFEDKGVISRKGKPNYFGIALEKSARSGKLAVYGSGTIITGDDIDLVTMGNLTPQETAFEIIEDIQRMRKASFRVAPDQDVPKMAVIRESPLGMQQVELSVGEAKVSISSPQFLQTEGGAFAGAPKFVEARTRYSFFDNTFKRTAIQTFEDSALGRPLIQFASGTPFYEGFIGKTRSPVLASTVSQEYLRTYQRSLAGGDPKARPLFNFRKQKIVQNLPKDDPFKKQAGSLKQFEEVVILSGEQQLAERLATKAGTAWDKLVLNPKSTFKTATGSLFKRFGTPSDDPRIQRISKNLFYNEFNYKGGLTPLSIRGKRRALFDYGDKLYSEGVASEKFVEVEKTFPFKQVKKSVEATQKVLGYGKLGTMYNYRAFDRIAEMKKRIPAKTVDVFRDFDLGVKPRISEVTQYIRGVPVTSVLFPSGTAKLQEQTKQANRKRTQAQRTSKIKIGSAIKETIPNPTFTARQRFKFSSAYKGAGKKLYTFPATYKEQGRKSAYSVKQPAYLKPNKAYSSPSAYSGKTAPYPAPFKYAVPPSPVYTAPKRPYTPIKPYKPVTPPYAPPYQQRTRYEPPYRPRQYRIPSIDLPKAPMFSFVTGDEANKQKKQYAPTLRAVFGGIKAKRGKTKRLTGLEERPILI